VQAPQGLHSSVLARLAAGAFCETIVTFSTVLFAEVKNGDKLDFPGPFWLRRLLSCPGNKEMGLNEPLTRK
jgi:hypothetical protein